ncbi:hypothetical protein PM082_022126 [Marasmius tenuissimus]|nr:hypothetical protein PM082_022126 [Marasmius tenuissimus]
MSSSNNSANNSASSVDTNNNQNPMGTSFAMTDIDQLVAMINTAVANRVPAVVEASLTTMLDDRLAFANQAAMERNNDGPAATGDTSTLSGAPMMGQICMNCNVLIPAPQKPLDRWYAIIIGHKVGWIQGWGFANKLTANLSGGLKMHCSNEQMAREMFHKRQLTGQVHTVSDGTSGQFQYTYQQGVLFS